MQCNKTFVQRGALQCKGQSFARFRRSSDQTARNANDRTEKNRTDHLADRTAVVERPRIAARTRRRVAVAAFLSGVERYSAGKHETRQRVEVRHQHERVRQLRNRPRVRAPVQVLKKNRHQTVVIGLNEKEMKKPNPTRGLAHIVQYVRKIPPHLDVILRQKPRSVREDPVDLAQVPDLLRDVLQSSQPPLVTSAGEE